MEHSTVEVSEVCKSERIQKMLRRICQIKASEKTEVKYMQSWEEKILIKQEGIAEGRLEGKLEEKQELMRKLSNKFSIEQIAEMLEIDTILEKYCNTKEALSMKNFCQHGSVSTYKHVMYVTRVCYYLNKHFGLGADVKSLVVGAFLHDFYLYDWHEKYDSHKWHGFSHAHTALLNADARFALTDKERDIIAHHMWPLN